MCVSTQTACLKRCKPSLAGGAILKVIKDKHVTDETTYPDAGEKAVKPAGPIDPRPLPATSVRHLDVNKVLERSLPPVENMSRRLSRD